MTIAILATRFTSLWIDTLSVGSRGIVDPLFQGVPSQPGCRGMQLSGYESWVLLITAHLVILPKRGVMISQYNHQAFQVLCKLYGYDFCEPETCENFW